MKTIVIAEIGENHLGNWALCRTLVEQAAAHGATYAKFQTYTAEQFGTDHVWYEDFKSVEMPVAVHYEMAELCNEKNVRFLSSTFSLRSTAFLVDRMKCDELKIASSRITDFKLLDDVNKRAAHVKTVYLSTGMSDLDEVKTAVEHLRDIKNLYLLHCVSQYPTDDENVNLKAMLTLMQTFPDIPVGYSDHSRGIEACVAAVALGATVLEKHFTLHTSMPGDDHAGGMTPEMLAELVARVQRVEAMLGSPEKKPLDAELKAREGLRIEMHEVGFEDV